MAADSIEIVPRGPLDADVRVPGSKSITNRALLVAALADGESALRGGLVSDDTEVMIAALRELGCAIELRAPSKGTSQEESWRVQGCAGEFCAPARTLQIENSGTSARFLTAAVTQSAGTVEIDGNARMRERPISDLVDALVKLGVDVEILGTAGCPPVRVRGGGLAGGDVGIDASRSSQYVTAILLTAPYARTDVVLHFEGGVLVSRPYVELTLDVMRSFGAAVDWVGADAVRVEHGRTYRGREFDIEPDASAAAYPFCAAAITGGRVRVEGIPTGSRQADFALLDILERMGCGVVRGDGFAEVRGTEGGLCGVDVDMNDLPDASLALAVVAAFAQSPTRIRNVANLRIKETDRLHALESELRKLGAGAHATHDTLTIEPAPLHGTAIDTYDDHRMAMAFSLAGLRVSGVAIRDPGCVTKTWPGYFTFLELL